MKTVPCAMFVLLIASIFGCARDLTLRERIAIDLKRAAKDQARGKTKIFHDDLMEAAGRGRLAEVKRLLKAGHPANVEDYAGNTPLLLAAYGDGSIPLTLAYGGGKVTKEMYESELNRRYIDIVRLLLSHNANPNHETLLGETPLKQAIITQQREIEALLRMAGATNEGRWIGRP